MDTLDLTKHYLPFKEAYKYINSNQTTMGFLIKENHFPGIITQERIRWIPITELDKFNESQKEYFTFLEVAQLLNYSSTAGARHLITSNKLPTPEKIGNMYKYKKEIIYDYINRMETENSNTCTLMEAKDLLQLTSRAAIKNLINNGELPNAYKGMSGDWCIPYTDIKEYQQYLEQPTKINKDILNENESIIYLNFSNKINLLTLIKNNSFPSAFKDGDNWRIPRVELEQYLAAIPPANQREITKNKEENNSPFNTYTLDQLKSKIREEFQITEIEKRIKHTEFSEGEFSRDNEFLRLVNHVLNNLLHPFTAGTVMDYLHFCRISINNLSGTAHYNIRRVRTYNNLFSKFNASISIELSKVPNSHIKSLIGQDSHLTVHERKIFLNFLHYYYDINNIVPSERLKFQSSTSEQNKEIYSPKQFKTLYEYAINSEIHIPKAISNRSYANMWVYVLLLLTDFIRGQDLIPNVPHIVLTELEIDSINWFEKNIVNQKIINNVINQIYSAFRHKRSNKTNELLTFIISPDISIALTNALIISEFHRRDANAELQLDTFIEGKYKKIQNRGKNQS